MKNYIEVASSFIEEYEKTFYKDGKPLFVLGKTYFIIVNNNKINISVSKSILNEDAIHRIICIEKKWWNSRGFLDYSKIEAFYLNKEGNILYDFIDGNWLLTVTPQELIAQSLIYKDFIFYFQELGGYETSLNHMWETFLKFKDYQTLEELIQFKNLYTSTNEKTQLVKELDNKNIENEILKRRLAEYERLLDKLKNIIDSFRPDDCDAMLSIVDSMPIVTCKGKNREGKVAKEITSKGYCSTKNMYYYGMKLHLVGQKRKRTLPFPEIITLTDAAENDLTAFKRECMPHLNGKTILGDKIYSDFTFFNDACPTIMLTPCKKVKGEAEIITQREKATRDLFSTAVSKVRQPIESFFNWLNEKTEIQRASKVRATKGLLVHIFGKLAIALLVFANL